MADAPAAPAQTPAPSKAKRRPPWGWLVLTLLVIGPFTFIVICPDLPQQWFGAAPAKPESLGDEPSTAGALSGRELAARNLENELLRMSKVTTSAPLLQTATKAPDAAPVKPIPTVDSADDAKAAPLLADAEEKYKAMDWDAAEKSARRITNLNAKVQIKGRAMDIERGAPLLKRLFAALNDRDELSRNWDTHPSLVHLSKAGNDMMAVPIISNSDPITPIESDPLAWINGKKRADGKAWFLVQGIRQFSPSQFDVTDYEASLVDQTVVRANRMQGLRQRLERIQADVALKRDPYAWYEAGKFAYRNRLDDQVTALLDKAVTLDPFLNRTVRENNAKELFGSMMLHMKLGNDVAANAFMASIERRYKDTDQARQARLYREGKTKEFLVAAREGERLAAAQAEERKRERESIAKKKSEAEVAKVIEEDKEIVEEAPTPVAQDNTPAPAALAKARDLVAKAMPLAHDASNMPPTDARNKKYHEAARILKEAKTLFVDYTNKHPEDEKAQVEAAEAKQMWFQVNKMATL